MGKSGSKSKQTSRPKIVRDVSRKAKPTVCGKCRAPVLEGIDDVGFRIKVDCQRVDTYRDELMLAVAGRRTLSLGKADQRLYVRDQWRIRKPTDEDTYVEHQCPVSEAG